MPSPFHLSAGSEVPSGGRFTVSSGRAVVSLSLDSTDREDAGNWTCTAQVYESDSTPLGPPVNVSVELIIVVAPSTPEDLSPYAVGPSWISFSWVQTSRGIPPLSRYMVLVVGGGEERNVTVEGSRTSTTVTNLLPGTTYMIRMVAVSEYGDVQAFSPPSNILITSTAASAPGLVCAEQPTVDGTELVISWSYNHTGGLNVTMTLVEYRAESSQNFIPLPSYMDMSGSGGPPLYSGSDSGLLLDTSASLPLPTAGVLYFFRVIASNEAGSTTVECPSVLTSIGIPATPDAPEVLFKSGGEVSLKLSTNQSGVNDPSVDTFHFILQVENASSGHVEVEVISIAVVCLEGGGVCSAFHFLSYLSPTHSYVITASAGNRYGTSEMSAPLTVPADDDIIDDVTTESNGGLGRTLIVGVSVGGGAALLMMCAVLVIAGCVVRRKSTTGSYDLSNDKKIGSGHSSMPMSSPLHSAPQPPQIHSEEALKRLYEIPVAYGSSPCRENTTFLPPKGPEEGRESRVYEEIDFDKQCQPPDVDFDTTDNTAYNVASFEKPAYINTTTGFSPPP